MISISIEVVVVLPCVPATASERAWAQIDASMPARVSTVTPICRASSSSMLRRGMALDAVTASMPCTSDAIVADVDVDARGADAFEDRMFPEIGARHGVAHLGQRDRDGAHSRAADADHVQPAGHGQFDHSSLDRAGIDRHGIDRSGGNRSGREGRHDGDDATATRSIKLAKAPRRCTSPRAGRRVRQRGAMRRDRRAGARSRRPGGRVASSRSITAPPTSVSHSMLSRW